MSARSAQAHQLGYEVARGLHLRSVEVRWSGSRKSGGFGGWRVEWTDGPTAAHMRTAIERYALRFPAVSVAELGYDRCPTALSEAIALLLYVDRDRSWVDGITAPLTLHAFDAIDWPERADQVWRDRARALLHLDPDADGSILPVFAVRALAGRARAGWDDALAWLDRLGVEHGARASASNVIDLTSHRRSRRVARVGRER